MSNAPEVASTAVRENFYKRLGVRHLAPLWEVLKALVPREPKPKMVPFQWRYADIRSLLLESGSIVTAEEAERRVLILENPSLVGQSRVTSTLYAGIQLILPGETAPAHRHTQSALRFMLEGHGAFTAVGGERTTMYPGDFVITPAWAWHDHGNEGGEPCAWLDGLDIPMIAFFESGFSEMYDWKRHPIIRPEGDSLARFGQGLLPIESASRDDLTTPIFNYPYERTREALLAVSKGQQPDAHLAITLRYSNPLDGGWTMPTISAWMTHLPRGFETNPLRSTDGMVMAVAEGRGTVRVGEAAFEFGPRDIHAIPGWTWRSFKADQDCFLFCFSDRVAQEKLGFFREERAGRGATVE